MCCVNFPAADFYFLAQKGSKRKQTVKRFRQFSPRNQYFVTIKKALEAF